VGGRWRAAVPGAAALEIAHNFSLVHDDIQDNSPTRRGRPALWKKYGSPMAINAGDALLAIANAAILDLRNSFPDSAVIAAGAILQATCLDLTRGQYLDLEHQGTRHLSLRGYWEMVGGKTAALLSASTQIGALLGGASRSVYQRYGEFGRLLGLAFQVQDDILGIWGNETLTGKSAASDLAEGKLSLPVLYGIRKNARFARLRGVTPPRAKADIARLRNVLQDEGAYSYSVSQGRRLTNQAQLALSRLKPRGTAGAALAELTDQLLGREN
jgi:geranylgeranyl diphosphate synthase type I